MWANKDGACQQKTWRASPWHLNVLLLVFGSILLLVFWVRIQGASSIPDGQFTGYDAYLYYWQTQSVAEHGHLPERDMHRWLPLGLFVAIILTAVAVGLRDSVGFFGVNRVPLNRNRVHAMTRIYGCS